MEYRIHGTTMQTLEVRLEPGESVFSEAGCLLAMTPGTYMETRAPGGLAGMFRRALSGNSVFLTYYRAARGESVVQFTTRIPGHILALPLRQYGRVIAERHSFLCAESTVDYGVEVTLNIGRFLGGNGLALTHLAGDGMAFLSIDGEIVERDLARGESLLVHPGHIAAFTDGIDYRVQLMQGVANMLFSGDGLFLVELTGPGRVWLHSVTVHNLVHIIQEYWGSPR